MYITGLLIEVHSKFCMDCNGSVHNLFQVCSLQICNGSLGQLTIANRSVEVHIVTDVWFKGMVISCMIQLVLNSSVATHIVTDVHVVYRYFYHAA